MVVSLKVIQSVHETLANSNDPVGLLRALVHGTLAPYGPVAGFITILLDDGNLLLIDSYGYEKSVLGQGVLHSVWENTAINDAIRSEQIITFPTKNLYLEKYPANVELNLPDGGFVGIPIWQRGFPLAGIGFALDESVSEKVLASQAEIWDCLRLVFEISVDRPTWLSSMEFNWEETKSKLISGTERNQPHSFVVPESVSLTPRQLIILEGLAEGLTNRQIASQLHLSESTIGKETISIYKALRTKNRNGAATVAKTLGLLDPTKEAS
jgi:DNA-binding CsgD family transcriptional regulator